MKQHPIEVYIEASTPIKQGAVGGRLPRLVRLWRRLIGRGEPDEMVTLLRSIDKRLQTLESCVRSGVLHRKGVSHIVTGHWND
jgi:hypothetical protein